MSCGPGKHTAYRARRHRVRPASSLRKSVLRLTLPRQLPPTQCSAALTGHVCHAVTVLSDNHTLKVGKKPNSTRLKVMSSSRTPAHMQQQARGQTPGRQAVSPSAAMDCGATDLARGHEVPPGWGRGPGALAP